VDSLGEVPVDLEGVNHYIDKRDVQWVVEVNDIFPSGRARNISSGWLSAENRPFDPNHPEKLDPAYVAFDPFYDHAYKNPSPIDEDTVYPYVIEVWPTDNVFKKGHRLRVSLSASDFPHLFPVFRPSENTLVIDEDHPARLDFTRVTGQGDAVWLDDHDPTDYVMESTH
jgi:predicted acyl esterase